jgi:hypothetical protein
MYIRTISQIQRVKTFGRQVRTQTSSLSQSLDAQSTLSDHNGYFRGIAPSRASSPPYTTSGSRTRKHDGLSFATMIHIFMPAQLFAN